ncbi:MAG: DUF1156 domain-containing protein [Chloroflexi bacterium]|nr:DUF1156 domain-containing protein [Chloroflexota bacterium]
MIPKACKRLAEVDFPIAEVSRHAAREKSIRHGHPSTLHIWWARRPLASSRAVLMALLLPDPCDPNCPEAFKTQAPTILSEVRQPPRSDEELRRALLWFIGAFANWDMAAFPVYLRVARMLVKAAHPQETPLVVDPFAGGGSIPLEALRLGCEAFASDLNPVACLILKVMLEDIPRHGPKLAEELQRVGAEIKAKAERELADLYPKDPDGATPIAYLWARTVRCEAPNCGAEIPLLRSLWLCKKPKRKRALWPRVERADGVAPWVNFEIFIPTADHEVPGGTVARARATCLCCGAVLAPERVRAQLASQRGGTDTVFDAEGNRIGGARMTAVVTLRSSERGRRYRLPTHTDYAAVRSAQKRVESLLVEWERSGQQSLCPVPNEVLPLMSGTFNVPIYGINTWGDLFTARQKLALVEFASGIARSSDGDVASLALAMVVGRCADYGSSGVIWAEGGEFVAHTFGRQALPMVWDFAEAAQLTDSSGNIDGAIGWIARVINAIPGCPTGQVEQADGADHPLPDHSASVWFTDPPYYFAVPYADLSDFFFVWLKRALPNHPLLKDPFDPDNQLTPKDQELCEMAHWDSERYPHKDQQFFEDGMAVAFTEGRRILHEDGIGSVVFAHKTTEGWEALLSGMIQGGWTITGSWPIATERPGRLRSQDSAALATSVHLICRPRSRDARIGDWADVLRELPVRVGSWMERLQGEGIRGADLVFACVGPALEIYSRYSAVETAEGREVALSEYLERVWEVVGTEALRQVLGTAEAQARNGLAAALEEDARLTALFLWTLQSTSGGGDSDEDEIPRGTAAAYSLPFDVVRRFAQPLGIHLDDWGSRIIETRKGVVRLLPVAARSRQLFGQSGAGGLADEIESSAEAAAQLTLFPAEPAGTRTRARRRVRAQAAGDELRATLEATTLDRVHIAMLFQGSGRTQALRNLLEAEQDRGPDFLRLANALSALYPRGSQEKRLLDAMLLAVPR